MPLLRKQHKETRVADKLRQACKDASLELLALFSVPFRNFPISRFSALFSSSHSVSTLSFNGLQNRVWDTSARFLAAAHPLSVQPAPLSKHYIRRKSMRIVMGQRHDQIFSKPLLK